MTQRDAVWIADDGRCVACGKEHARRASSWAWQAHHVIKQQTLRRRGVAPARIRDATFAVLLCRAPCHAQHEAALPRVPLERLPDRVVAVVDALGPWAQDELRRYHPPTGTGGGSAGMTKG